MTALPIRPRLVEHALVRRHLVDGAEIVVIHDARNGNLVRMGTREWDLVAGADGTRDLDALALAAARRGALPRASELRSVLEALQGAGLLADGIAHPAPPLPTDPARPLDVLPSFSLTCDGRGGCCTMYGSVIFTPLEAARARALMPETLDGGEHEERAFSPERGATRDGALAVTLVDGRCAYLAGDGRCAIHVAGGERAKPRGCRTYPATFVDDGEAVRVSVGVECACVLASAGAPGGAPLVDPAARTRGDLGPAARVVSLAETIALRGGEAAPRAAYSAWSSRIAAALPERADGVSIAWSLADAIDRRGLDVATSLAALASPHAPTPAEIAPLVEALAARAKARVDSADAWRAGGDRARLASHWMRAAADRLLDPAARAAALADPSFQADEIFFLRAQIHGRLPALDGPLSPTLRDRATRMLVARALAGVLPEGEPARLHPLALVEAMMRGGGLAAYASASR